MQRGLMSPHEVNRGLQEALDHERGKVAEEKPDGTAARVAVASLEKVATYAKEAAAKVKAGNYPGAVFKLTGVVMETRSAVESILVASGKIDSHGAEKIEKITQNFVVELNRVISTVKK